MMGFHERIEHLRISLKIILLCGFRRERIISRSSKLTSDRWLFHAKREPTDSEYRSLIYGINLFEEHYHRRPNEQETDDIIQRVLNLGEIADD